MKTRRNLSQCIELFKHDSAKIQAVKFMEELGEWETAEKYWRKLGKHEDAEACKLIKESIEKGDLIRKSCCHKK